jgi:hypothetical protein
MASLVLWIDADHTQIKMRIMRAILGNFVGTRTVIGKQNAVGAMKSTVRTVVPDDLHCFRHHKMSLSRIMQIRQIGQDEALINSV